MKSTIQEQRIAARRNQILDSAATVFAAKGFHSTSIRDIARDAGIADGTIYNYFENKTALLFGLLDRMKETAQQDLEATPLPQDDPRATLAAYLRHPLMVFKAGDFALFKTIMSEIMVNVELRSLYYERIVVPAIALAENPLRKLVQTHLNPDLDFALALRTISGLVTGLILQHIMGDEILAARWDELPDVLADLLLNGLKGGDR